MSANIELPPPPLPPSPSPLSAQATADAEFTAPLPDSPLRTCPNCGAPAHGPYCYACGQSEKGMIRHLSEVMSDLADIVFNVDSRIFRSLWDLYFRPGYLTTEYVAGRRARYVTPFRLFFFLSIIAFFSMQMALPEIKPDELKFAVQDDIEAAATAEEVTKAVAATVAELHVALRFRPCRQRHGPGSRKKSKGRASVASIASQNWRARRRCRHRAGRHPGEEACGDDQPVRRATLGCTEQPGAHHLVVRRAQCAAQPHAGAHAGKPR
ncbi:MAG: DUF3667 domain-containing protein [Xanthomonadales bacterium]|nr:DUF3667 domain-containing protein [Xanthomonadales bacterium]